MGRAGTVSHRLAATTSRVRGPRLREAAFQDYQQLAQLYSRHGLAIQPLYEEWSHLWLENPVYRQLRDGWKIGWVLEDHDGRIVGAMSNIPLAYCYGGKPILATTGRGWVADLPYRSASLVLLDCLLNQPSIDLYLNTTFSVSSTPAVTVFHCARVPVGAWDRSAFWITNYTDFARGLVARKSLPNPLSHAVAAALVVRGRLAPTVPRRDDVPVTACPAFDERFDEFWESLQARHPQLLLAVRTREALAWHYKYALLHNRLWIATVRDGARIIAYALFDRRDGAAGITRIRLVDYQSLENGTLLLLPLLRWALDRCRAEGIHVLESFGRWLEKGELFDRIAPFHRTLPAWLYVYRANSPWLAEALQDRRAWAPSLYDGDASLAG